MQLNEYQNLALSTAEIQDVETDVMHFGFGLVSEAGEVAKVFQKYARGDKRYNSLASDEFMYNEDFVDWYMFTPYAQDKVRDELGDVLWHVAALASTFGVTLEELAEQNVLKLKKREVDGTIKGDEDLR